MKGPSCAIRPRVLGRIGGHVQTLPSQSLHTPGYISANPCCSVGKQRLAVSFLLGRNYAVQMHQPSEKISALRQKVSGRHRKHTNGFGYLAYFFRKPSKRSWVLFRIDARINVRKHVKPTVKCIRPQRSILISNLCESLPIRAWRGLFLCTAYGLLMDFQLTVATDTRKFRPQHILDTANAKLPA